MIPVLYIMWLAKGTSWDEATLSSEKIKPVRLILLAEGISLLVRKEFCSIETIKITQKLAGRLI